MKGFDRAAAQECARQILEVLSRGGGFVKGASLELGDFDFGKFSEGLGEMEAGGAEDFSFDGLKGVSRRGIKARAGEILAEIYSRPGWFDTFGRKGAKSGAFEGRSGLGFGGFGELGGKRQGAKRGAEIFEKSDGLGAEFFEGAADLRRGRSGAFEDFDDAEFGAGDLAARVYDGATGERGAKMESISDFFRRDARRYDAFLEKF